MAAGRQAGQVTPPVPDVPGVRIGDPVAVREHSTVWAGVRDDGTRVAVKVVPLAPDGGAPGDVLGYGRTWPYVVPVLEVLAISDPEPATAVVMPLLDGGSYAAVVAARGRLSPGEVVTALAPMAGALGTLHAAGLVHADLSPGNVLFDGSGRPWLADLGVARIVGDVVSPVWGTQGYLAPEVEAGAEPSAAADVFGVGALAWLALVGEPPGPSFVRTPLAQAAPGLPEEFTALLERCLHADPTVRPSAEALALELFDAAAPQPLRLPVGEADISALTRRIRAGAPPPAGAPRPGSAPAGGVRPTPYAPRHRAPRRLGGVRLVRPVRLPVLVVVLAAALVTGVTSLAVARARTADVAGSAGPLRQPAVTTTQAVTATQAVGAHGTPAGGDPTSSQGEPARVAEALLQARARLWNGLDIADLALVDAPGSSAWRVDAELVTSARADGWRYEAVAFTVRSARWHSQAAGAARLEVVYDAAAYRLRQAQKVTERAAQGSISQVLDLRRVDGAWRVAAVTGT